MPHKGTVNNPNGRPKGSLNKRTILMRKQVAEAMDKNLVEAISLIGQLPIKDRLNMIAKFMPFTIPRYNNVDIIEEIQEERLQQDDHDRTVANILKKILTDEQKKQLQVEYIRSLSFRTDQLKEDSDEKRSIEG